MSRFKLKLAIPTLNFGALFVAIWIKDFSFLDVGHRLYVHAMRIVGHGYVIWLVGRLLLGRHARHREGFQLDADTAFVGVAMKFRR